MSDPVAFRTVLRGYDPGQVDQRVAALRAELGASADQVADLSRHVQALERRLAERAAEDAEERVRPDVARASFADLGARIGQMLALAEEEAAEMVGRAAAEAEAVRRETEAAARLV